MDAKKNKPAPERAATATTDESRRPVKTFRLDDCSLSLWARERVVRGETVVFWSMTLERSFKDANGTWKYTKSFDAQSIGKVVTLCQQANEYLREQMNSDTDASEK